MTYWSFVARRTTPSASLIACNSAVKILALSKIMTLDVESQQTADEE